MSRFSTHCLQWYGFGEHGHRYLQTDTICGYIMSGANNTREEENRRLVFGWHGRFYENFTVSDVYKHSYDWTITETDDVWLTTSR